MPYRVAQLQHLLAIRWEHQTTLEDLERMRLTLRPPPEAEREKWSLVVVVDRDCQAPESDARKKLNETMAVMLPAYGKRAVVIEGGGLVAEVKRTFTRALFALSRVQAPLFATVGDALQAGLGMAPEQAAKVQAELRGQGFPT